MSETEMGVEGGGGEMREGEGGQGTWVGQRCGWKGEGGGGEGR